MMRYFAILFSLFIAFGTKAQKPFLRNLILNETGTSVKVNDLAQDSYGYIWLATDDGLYSYNGQAFLHVPDTFHVPITALCNYHNTIYAGFSNGKMGKLINGVVQPMPVMGGPAVAINSIKVDSTGMFWLTTDDGGLFALFRNVAISFSEQQGLSDDFTYTTADITGNRILVASDEGINDISLTFGKPVVTPITTAQGLSDNIVRVVAPIPGTEKVLVGTQEKGIAMYDYGIHTIIYNSPSWAYGQINDIIVLPDNIAWVATEDGYLIKLHLAGYDIIAQDAYYYPDKKFRKLLVGASGNIWCATTDGLSMCTGTYLYHVPLPAPYSLSEATAIAHDTADVLYVALKEKLYSLKLNTPQPQMALVLDAKTAITSLYNSPDNTLWIGTWGGGLYRKAAYATPSKLPLTQFAGDPNIINMNGTDGKLWVAGLEGVDEYSFNAKGLTGLIHHHGKSTGVGTDYVYQLFPDHNGNMWMATDGAGICMYNGRSYYHWPVFHAASSKVAYTVTQDVNGDIWAGTLYKDLYRYHDKEWKNMRRPETQYPDINISGVIAGPRGQVVSVYQRCIDEWYPKSNYFRHFNSAMGIGIDSTSSVLNCIANDKAGNVYVPYKSGILILVSQDSSYDIRPKVRINKLNVNQQQVVPFQTRFSYDRNYISFNFDGVNFTNHERLNYRYKLVGHSKQWIKTSDASVTFTNLPPGKYDFRIQVSLTPHFHHALEDHFIFTITPPFWRTIWFYLLIAGILVYVGYTYITWRERNLKKISQLQQERMLFEYEHLKSQVNPHFLFNSLNTLTGLIEESQESAVDYTVHLSDLYRNMLTYRNKDLIPLSEEITIMNDYVHIQHSRFGEAFNVVMDIPQLLMTTKHVVPLALQLLVENAIKHNVVSIAQPLTINITATESEITVRNHIQPRISPEKGSGLGLANIRKRYRLLTDKEISWGANNGEFIVTLPLL